MSNAKARWWETCSDEPMDMLSWVEEQRRVRLFIHACLASVPLIAADTRFARILGGFLRAADENHSTTDLWVGIASRASEFGWEYRGESTAVAELIDAAFGAAYASDIYGATQFFLQAVWRNTGDDATRHCTIIREIFGNPFRPIAFSPEWRTDTAIALARQMYESRDFSAMPILADALQDAGCDNESVLTHCRDTNQPHVRGCWVVDLVLGK